MVILDRFSASLYGPFSISSVSFNLHCLMSQKWARLCSCRMVVFTLLSKRKVILGVHGDWCILYTSSVLADHREIKLNYNASERLSL